MNIGRIGGDKKIGKKRRRTEGEKRERKRWEKKSIV
jgi:hypothetical protein